MKEYQQKHIIRTLVYSRTMIVILFIFCLLLLRSLMELNNKRIETAKLKNDSALERSDLENKLAKSEEKNNEISSSRGLENYIRTTYPVVKDGEGVIVVYDDTKDSPVSQVREDVTFWEQLLIFWNRITKHK